MADHAPGPLIRAIDEALDLLRAHDPGGDLPVRVSGDPLPSLLEQCRTLCGEAALDTPPPVRSLHHFACSGGTLMSKCIAAQPNTVLLSEIDPLSTLHLRHARKPFFPTDTLADLRHGVRSAPEGDLVDIFMTGLVRIRDLLAARGQNLVLRDHAHSQFCTKVDGSARPTLHAILAARVPLRSVVTLRHPLDSFLSLSANGWDHFAPFTLEEYSQRYLAFLAAHAGIEWILYEDFVESPQEVTQRMCALLDLPFDPGALDLIGVFQLSGDSGRSSTQIGPRARRSVPEAIARQAAESPAYARLCKAIRYQP